MPEEMMTRTTDSSAVAMGETGGLSNAVTDFIRDTAGSDDNSQWATSEQAGQDADQFGEYESDGGDDENYDDLISDILGEETPRYSEQEAYSEQPNPVPYERFREVNERARQAEEYENKLQKWAAIDISKMLHNLHPLQRGRLLPTISYRHPLGYSMPISTF